MPINEDEIVEMILKAKAPVSITHITRRFKIKGNDRRDLRGLLKQLVDQGKIARVRGKNYTAPSGKSQDIIGRLEVTSRGFGFVRPDWGDTEGHPPFTGDLFIPQNNLGKALDGDIVRAELIRKQAEGPMGRIQEVIEHAHRRIVGRYQINGKKGQVFPRNNRIERRIVVPHPPKDLKVEDFDWVEVEISEFGFKDEPLYGEVINRIGSDDENGIDVLLVLRDMGIFEEFPDSVEAEVKDMHFVWEKDLKDRVDYRDRITLTIDPKTAKDFDDGLSIERNNDGTWTLYVHIADVAHFVRQGTALDREAHERSTSIYPIDRVVPMLPSKLSNFLCSLRPNEDRLAMTAVMVISEDGDLLSKKVHSSVIHSDRRFTYEEVQSLIDGNPPEHEHDEELLDTVHGLRKVASLLRKRRFARGALDLDIPELKVMFDESGSVSDLKFYERFESHKIVEECMLIANEAVAQLLTEKEIPLLYRIHEVADEARLLKLIPTLKAFGIRLGSEDGNVTPKDIQKALEQAQKHEAGHILRRLVLRAMKRAEYDPENVGHFGLASECYCHFTSPIRRYPDVVVHRQLKALEGNRKPPYNLEEGELDELGEHTSRLERRAQEAEWEATEIKSLEFINGYVGDEFDAYICSVHSWGLFIELEEYPVEGLLRLADLKNDHYELDDSEIRLVGKRTGHTLKLADKVRVQVVRVDPLSRKLDLELLDIPKAKPGKKPVAKTRKTRKKK